MAEATKAELETEVKELRKRVQEYQDAGVRDNTWYVNRLNELEKELEVTKGDLQSLQERTAREERDRIQQEADRKAKEAGELKHFHLDQNEHTRFRFRERPVGRDIFGDVVHPVFDLGVELDFYSGAVQVPAPVVVEMAQSIGMLTIEQADHLKRQLDFEKTRNEKAGLLGNDLIADLRSRVDAFYADLDSAVLDAPSADESESDAVEDAGKSDESDSVEESDGVPSDSDNADSDGDSDGTGLKLPKLDV